MHVNRTDKITFLLENLFKQYEFNPKNIIFESGMFDHIGDDIKQELIRTLNEAELEQFITDPKYFDGMSFINTSACAELREVAAEAAANLTNMMILRYNKEMPVYVIAPYMRTNDGVVETHPKITSDLVIKYMAKNMDNKVKKDGFSGIISIKSRVSESFIQISPGYVITLSGTYWYPKE